MIGRPTGIKIAVTFDPFMVVPARAWKEAKDAIIAMLASRGFRAHVDDVGGQPEAYERWQQEQYAAMDAEIAAQADVEAKAK